jgi:ppGpp synthetase/RelA/SpoT-type nucleotidyltranferase
MIVDLNCRPPWSNNALRRLGAALRDGADPPSGYPSYAHVLLWYADLADEVQNQIENGSWAVASELQATSSRRMTADLLVSSRAKTEDTLVEKLRRRPYLQLNAVQDIAGVRIDADLLLSEQTRLAREIAEHFGADESAIHDLRVGAHAGYRAVHVWLRMPAGRVEIQIRTLLQSLWANVYERLADTYGRGIRYGDPIDRSLVPDADPAQIRQLVQKMQDLSATLATTEATWQQDSEIEDPSQRAMPLGADAMNKAMMFEAVLHTLRGEINPAGWEINPAGSEGEGG